MDGYIVNVDGTSSPASRAAAEAGLRDGSMLWLDLRGAGDDEMEMLRNVFHFHPVALDDVAEFGQRPKVEGFSDVVYIVTYAATATMGELIEVHAFYSATFLVTVRKLGCHGLDQLRRQLSREGYPPTPPNRPARLVMLHHILDSMTDSFFPPLADLDDQIDAVTEQIFDRPSKQELSTMLELQRWLVGVRKTVTPQRDVMAALLSGVVELPGRTAESDPYLRDLYDHVIRISDLIDSYRDLLSNAMDAYLSMVSNQQNEVMKQLAVIATVFLPLSFLTGFFGQNFTWLVGHLGGLPVFLGIGLGSEVVAAAGLYLLFRKRGWL